MQQRYPGRIRESASPSGNSAVFKNWAFRQYQAPTVTYEVGDKTGREQMHELATFAPDRAIRIRLNESRPDACTDRKSDGPEQSVSVRVDLGGRDLTKKHTISLRNQ